MRRTLLDEKDKEAPRKGVLGLRERLTLHDLNARALEEGRPLEVVFGNASGWSERWSCGRNAAVVKDEPGELTGQQSLQNLQQFNEKSTIKSERENHAPSLHASGGETGYRLSSSCKRALGNN